MKKENLSCHRLIIVLHHRQELVDTMGKTILQDLKNPMTGLISGSGQGIESFPFHGPDLAGSRFVFHHHFAHG